MKGKHTKESKRKIREWSLKYGFQKGNQFWKLKKSHKGPTQSKSKEWKKSVGKIRRERIKEGKIIPAFLGKKRPEHSKKMSGKENPNWQGGIAFEPYDIRFNNKFKRAIRKRDNYICLKCDKHQEKEIGVLSIHHINYDKRLSIKENCCAVCRKCNAEVNINRIHWTKFFQSLLSEKYGYKYSNQEIILEVNQNRN